MSTTKEPVKTTWRTARFHLSSDQLCVVEPHPQATSKFALEQGTIIMRFEAHTTIEFRQGVVDLLNRARFTEVCVSEISLHYAERCARAGGTTFVKPPLTSDEAVAPESE